MAISDVVVGGEADPKSPQGFRLTLDPKTGGGLHALDLATGKIVWSAKPVPCHNRTATVREPVHNRLSKDGLFSRAIGCRNRHSRRCFFRLR